MKFVTFIAALWFKACSTKYMAKQDEAENFSISIGYPHGRSNDQYGQSPEPVYVGPVGECFVAHEIPF